MVFSTGGGRGGGVFPADSVASSCLRGGLERFSFLDGQHPAPEILT